MQEVLQAEVSCSGVEFGRVDAARDMYDAPSDAVKVFGQDLAQKVEPTRLMMTDVVCSCSYCRLALSVCSSKGFTRR